MKIKIERVEPPKPKFEPLNVTITIESDEDLENLRKALVKNTSVSFEDFSYFLDEMRKYTT